MRFADPLRRHKASDRLHQRLALVHEGKQCDEDHEDDADDQHANAEDEEVSQVHARILPQKNTADDDEDDSNDDDEETRGLGVRWATTIPSRRLRLTVRLVVVRCRHLLQCVRPAR